MIFYKKIKGKLRKLNEKQLFEKNFYFLILLKKSNLFYFIFTLLQKFFLAEV